MTYSDEKHIEYIIENFNFDRVLKFMIDDKWGWGIDGKIPTIMQLKSAALDLLMSVKDLRYGDTCSTGGFVAKKQSDNLELFFTIEDRTSEYVNFTDTYKKDKQKKLRVDKLNNINELSS